MKHSFDYEKAFPPMPQSTHLRTQKTLGEVETMKNKKPIVSLVFALLVALLLAGIAYAATQTTFFDYLLGYGGTSSEGLQSVINPIDTTMVFDGIRFTVTDSIVDGDYIYIGWDTENLRTENPAVVVYESVEIDGNMLSSPADFPYYQWLPNYFGLGANWSDDPVVSSGMTGRLKDVRFGDIATVKITLLVKRPTKPLAVVDPELYSFDQSLMDDPGYKGFYQDHVDLADYIRSKGIPVAAEDEMDAEAWQRKGYTVINLRGDYYADGAYYSEYDMPNMTAVLNLDLDVPQIAAIEQVGRYTVEFQLDMKNTAVTPINHASGKRYALGEIDVEITELTFWALSTNISYTIYIKDQNATPDQVENMLDRYTQVKFTDTDGNPLVHTGMGIVVNDSSPGAIHKDENGRWCIRAELVIPGLAQIPTEIVMRFPGENNNVLIMTK